MMWRLMHWLLEWQYVLYWHDDEWKIRRVREAPNGMGYIVVWGMIRPIDTIEPKRIRGFTFGSPA